MLHVGGGAGLNHTLGHGAATPLLSSLQPSYPPLLSTALSPPSYLPPLMLPSCPNFASHSSVFIDVVSLHTYLLPYKYRKTVRMVSPLMLQ